MKLSMERLHWRWTGSIYLACFKAAIAITLGGVILPLCKSYEGIVAQPEALSWLTCIVCIIGSSGKTIGGCVEAVVLSLLGLAGGCLAFWCLSLLGKHGSAVGQGIVFALVVYLFALIRWRGARWIPLYLVGVLFSFQGIYTSVTSSEGSSSWLLGYFQAYAFGLAIVLVVNITVWPSTSEGELRDLVVTSLQHVSTLAHLSCKTYACDIAEDEKDVRDLLIQTIRKDFSALTARLDEASYEVLWSKFKMTEYRAMIAKVRGLQQALITSSSSLDLILSLDPEGVNLRHMAKPEFTSAFANFRHGFDLVISEIIDVLAGVSIADLERGQPFDPEAQLTRVQSRVPSIRATQNLPTISARLREEVNRSAKRHQHLRTTSSEGHREDKNPSENVRVFWRAWEHFSFDQTEAIIQLIKDGALEINDELHITMGAPSLQVLYSKRLPKAWTSSLVSETPLRRVRSKSSPALPSGNLGNASVLPEAEREDDEIPCSEALTKSYSLLFGLGTFSEELCALHSVVCVPRTSAIRFHIFEDPLKRSWRRDPDAMTLQEALAALAGTVYRTPRIGLVRRIVAAEKWFRSDHSLYALKVALGATIYSLLLLTESPRAFFIQYGATSSLITVIVAISPSLGQTLTTFILQLLGTGIGSVYGMVVLEIFKNVGGYRYNPYGLSVAFFIWCLLSSWPLYYSPKYYTGALLAANGAGTIIVMEWQHVSVAVGESAYPDPPLRAAYAIASMCISILIAALFQVVIFRTPARRQLRLRIAAITFALSSYNTILQSNINKVAPADFAPPPPHDAVKKIQKELIKREAKLQADIIALSPLWAFAKSEPEFIDPFPGDILLKIIQSHQLILDRLREARTAVGMTGFSYTVHHDIASTLYPYRLHSQRLARTLFYLGATSLMSKTPLPRDVPSSRSTWRSFEHDALLLSRRLSKRGDDQLREPGFLRYWFYLVSMNSVSDELEKLEAHLGELFGVPETTNPNIS